MGIGYLECELENSDDGIEWTNFYLGTFVFTYPERRNNG